MNEKDLESEINQLIHNLNGTTFDQNGTTISNPGNLAELYPIEKQITKVRKELCDTNNMFINAKNLLSNISFENVDKHFKDQISLIGEKCQLLLNDQCDEDNFFDSFCKVVHQCHDIPELHTIATAVNELKTGISKMENNYLLLDDLYEDVWKSVACSDSDNTLFSQQNSEVLSTECNFKLTSERDDNLNM